MIKILPPEILAQVFRNLTEECLRESVSLVCKEWYQIMQDFNLAERRVVWSASKAVDNNDILHDLERFPTFGRKVKSVIIKQSGYYTEFGSYRGELFPIEKVLQLCDKLEELNLIIMSEDTLNNVLSVLTNSENYLSHMKLFEMDCQGVWTLYSSPQYTLDIANG